MKDKIKKYLANGIRAEQVATIVGCSPAYISQLLKDESFKKEVEVALMDNKSPEDEVLASRYLGLESSIIREMNNAVAGAELPHLTRALETVVKAQVLRQGRLQVVNGNGGTVVQNVVNVQIPAHLLRAPVINLNENSEVVAINDKPLAPMPADGVRDLFAKLTVQRNISEFEVPNELSNSQNQTTSIPSSSAA